MSEKVNKFASIIAIKAVICSFFTKLSNISGGGGHSKPKTSNFSLLSRLRTLNFGFKSFPHEEFFLMA